MNLNQSFISDFSEYYRWSQRIKIKYKPQPFNSLLEPEMSPLSETSIIWEPPRDKTNKMACVPSEDSDQPGHPPSLIRVFAVRLKKARILSYPLSTQWRLWSDWSDAQADLSLHWVRMPFRWFCHNLAHILFERASKALLILSGCAGSPELQCSSWR